MNEYAFLYSCILNEEARKEIPHLNSNIFLDDISKIIFHKISELIKKHNAINMALLKNSVSEEIYLTFTSNIPQDVDINAYKAYLEAIQNDYAYGNLEKAGAIIRSGIINKEEPLKIISNVNDLNREAIYVKSTGSITTPASLILKFEEDMASNNPRILFGFEPADDVVGTYDYGDFVIVAGRPSFGKTAYCLHSMINKSVYLNEPTAFISLEMSAKSLMNRTIANVAGITHNSIRLKKLSDRQMENYRATRERIINSPINIIEDTYTIPAVEARLELLKQKYPELTFVYLDYVQLMGVENKEISIISNEIKRIAKKLELIFVVISQLSRLVEQREDKRPMLSDLRESGALEQTADVVIFLYGDWYYKQDVKIAEKDLVKEEIIIAKNRNGETGTVLTKFDKKTQRFLNFKDK